MNRIFLSSPDVGRAEREALGRAFDTGYIAALGPELDAFEAEVASYCDRAYGVGLSSGTSALHLSLLALGVGPGDVVITSSMTFAATANAIVHAGAAPVFVDCDVTGNIDPELARRAALTVLDGGYRIGAIMPVDLLGKVADYDRIEEWADPLGISVVADAAEGMGAHRDGRPAGSFGVAAAVSFNGNKPITTSGGGMLLTDDEVLASKARKLATQAREPVPWYEHAEVGYNYRLSNLLAGLGRAQLERLPEMLRRRREVREFYTDLFGPVEGVEVFNGSEDSEDSCWLTSVLVDERKTGWGPASLIAALDQDDIEARHLWKPMHLQPVYASSPFFSASGQGSVSASLFERGVTLPSGSVLSDDDLDRIASSVSRFLEKR